MPDEELAIDIVFIPDQYDDGRKTHTVSVLVNGIPHYDADGPTMEWALLQLIHNLVQELERDA